MAERRPLVIVAGAFKELPPGDTLPSGGGTLDDLTDVNTAGVGEGYALVFDADSPAGWVARQRVTTIDATFDGGGAAITAGLTCEVTVPVACTVLSATLLADATGSIVVDVQKTSYASYDASFASICAAAKPTISAAKKAQDTTLTGWTTALAANDVLRFIVDSAATIERAQLQLKVALSA